MDLGVPIQHGNQYGPIFARGNARLFLGNVYQQSEELNNEQKCYQALKTSSYEKHKDRNPSRVAGTCRWVLDHQQFRQWRANQYCSPILWISADPGCGKSVLSKALIDDALCSDDMATVCYFFFKDNEEQDSLPTALCALLHQLFSHQPHLLRHAIPAWERNGDSLCEESLQLWRIIQTAAADRNAGPLIFVIDALDECKDADRRQLIQLLCDLQHRSQDNASVGRLKVLVTSRPYDSVQRWFEQTTSTWPNIRLRGEDENDSIHREIDLVIVQQIQDVAREFFLAVDVQNRIQQQLLNMQNRTYLWLHLAMDEVRAICRDNIYSDDIQVISLPTSVEDAYERILSKVNARQSVFARQILLIVVGARRPLSLTEMAHALGAARASEHNQSCLSPLDPARLEKQIPNLCGLFVFINHSHLFLIHQTAKEFLVAKRFQPERISPPWKSCLEETQIELKMTNICVTYLNARNVEEVTWSLSSVHNNYNVTSGKYSAQWDVKSSDAFWQYCAEYWTSHLKDDFLRRNPSLLSKALLLFATNGRLFPLWFPFMWQMVRWHTRTISKLSCQHVLAMTGHTFALQHVLKVHTDDGLVNARDSKGWSALQWATRRGHVQIVQLLLDRGAVLETQNTEGDTALHIASEYGQEQIVRLLLDRGIAVNVRNSNGDTALHAASRGGHERIVRLLLERGANANVFGRYSDALLSASARGYEQIVRLLLDRGAMVTHQEHGQDALHAASAGGHEQVVELLLERGANVNSASIYCPPKRPWCFEFGDALQAASCGGHEKIVEMLLERGANVNSHEGQRYESALLAATVEGYEKIVQLLLNWGASVNTFNIHFPPLGDSDQGSIGDSSKESDALQAASYYGYEKVVRILLQNGANVNAPAGDYGNALCAASIRGHEDIVQLLLDRGAAVNASSRYRCRATGSLRVKTTALEAASYCGNHMVVQILLQHGADVSAWGGEHVNALYMASAGGHEEVAEMLIEYGADVNAEGGTYGNALCVASAQNYGWMVETLLENGADVNAEAQYGNALYTASAKGNVWVVKMLLDNGAHINAKGAKYGTALSIAIAKGHEEVEQILRDRGGRIY